MGLATTPKSATTTPCGHQGEQESDAECVYRLAGRAARRPPRERVVVIPSTRARLPHAAPAGEMYTGALHRAARAAADALTRAGGRVLVLGPGHGLVAPDKVIEPPADEGMEGGTQRLAELRDQARALNVEDETAEVIVLGGGPHAAAAVKLWPRALLPLRECGQAEYMRRLAHLAKLTTAAPQASAETPESPAPQPEPVAEPDPVRPPRSAMTDQATAATEDECAIPGCTALRAPKADPSAPGPRPKFCSDAEHNAKTLYTLKRQAQAAQRRQAAQDPVTSEDSDRPVTDAMAEVAREGGSVQESIRQLLAQLARYDAALRVAGDLDAVAAQVEAAEARVTTAEARAAEATLTANTERDRAVAAEREALTARDEAQAAADEAMKDLRTLNEEVERERAELAKAKAETAETVRQAGEEAAEAVRQAETAAEEQVKAIKAAADRDVAEARQLAAAARQEAEDANAQAAREKDRADRAQEDADAQVKTAQGIVKQLKEARERDQADMQRLRDDRDSYHQQWQDVTKRLDAAQARLATLTDQTVPALRAELEEAKARATEARRDAETYRVALRKVDQQAEGGQLVIDLHALSPEQAARWQEKPSTAGDGHGPDGASDGKVGA